MASTGLSMSAPAAPADSGSAEGMRCPDPSAHQHTKNNGLQNQASAAALYATKPGASKEQLSRAINPLGPDGKLSSASAATSLKYAKASDLPGFPIVGIDLKNSAGAAALLANQNQKSPEWWKPEQSSAAGKAALLAHKDGVNLNLWKPEASADGHSAATIAMRKQNLGPGAVDYGYTDDGRKNAFTAATGAHTSAGLARTQAVPVPPESYPDARNSAKNALGAASLAHSASVKATPHAPAASSKNNGLGAMEAARIQHAKGISREMYGSAPPVALETEEKNRNAALQASAISMAKKMYDVQQHQTDNASAARSGATIAHGQQPATGEEDIKQQAMRYIGIQEAAQKLAQERLAKIGYDENAAYRSYYGYEKQPRSKLSLRRGHKTTNSDSKAAPADDSDSDEDDFRSRRIRSQMEQFNKTLADVDAKKRENDRKFLLAAAERKVQAQMQAQDQKIYDKTGKMTPAMIDEWDAKARQKAAANSETRMENHGKVHIGNGKWMDQSEIDAIAQARIQPTLDEIADKTEKRRAEDEKRRAEEEERKMELEEKKRRETTEKERAAEIKAGEKQLRDEEKRTAKQEKEAEKTAAKQEKEAEKAKKAEQDRMAKEEKRKSNRVSTAAPVAAPVAAGASTTANDTDDLIRNSTTAAPVQESDATSPTSPKGGLKSMFSKLKRRSKHTSAGSFGSGEVGKDKETGFVGGATLRSSTSQSQAQSHTSPTRATSGDERPHNLGDVEPAAVPHVNELDDTYSDVSSLEEPRGRSKERLTGAPTKASGATEFEEAQDHFDEGLAPPPTFTTDADKETRGSPTRDSKFREVGI